MRSSLEILAGSCTWMSIMISVFLPFWYVYEKGIEDGIKKTQREAFELGFMIKDVHENDTVIYKWIHSK